jgi:uncharacterized protein YyaL (SSP411 family)
MRERLERVRSSWRKNKQEIQRGLRELWAQGDRPSAVGSRLRRQMVEDIVDAVYEKLDHRHGGFGDGIKFPHPEAIDFALVQVMKRNDERMREVVTLTLDHMLASPLHDPVDGGFFRFSRTPDWHTPNPEKLILTSDDYREIFCIFIGYREFLATGRSRYCLATSESNQNSKYDEPTSEMISK